MNKTKSVSFIQSPKESRMNNARTLDADQAPWVVEPWPSRPFAAANFSAPPASYLRLSCRLFACRGAEEMLWNRAFAAGVISLSLGCVSSLGASDLKITIPRRSHLTPVQRLNREGVDAVRNHHYQKAEALFYKAYLFDPDDPFTLNNLGYVSELVGDLDRARRFYELASKQPTDAIVDRASSKPAQGLPLNEALAQAGTPLAINHANVEAVRLLSEKRAAEADALLQNTLKSDPNNVFTLNNLGVAKESEGESQAALRYYDAAAARHSDAAAIVTFSRSWRGKPVTAIAAENASRLRRRLSSPDADEIRVAELNLRGVAALNRNDWRDAERDFRAAYAADPGNAFALNNIGYVAEIEGDPETAQFFYDRAQSMAGTNVTVGLASRASAQGARLSQVASQSDSQVEASVAKQREVLRQQHAPILLRRRDNSLVEETSPQSGTTESNPQP